MEAMNEGQRMFLEAEQYAWSLTEHPSGPVQMGPQMDERLRRGLKARGLIPEPIKGQSIEEELAKNPEVRSLPEVPVIIGITEKEAAVCLRFTDGRMDYAGFLGSDPIFHNWVQDLFLFYWDKGKELR
jgi:hypothetical protein